MEAFRIALDEMAIYRKRYIMCIMLSVISGILVILSVALYKGIRIGYENYDHIVNNGADSVAIIRILDTQADYEELIRDIYNLRNVSAVGTMDIQGSTYVTEMKELLDIQRGHAHEDTFAANDILEMRIVNPTLLPMCDLKLQKGKKWEELDKKEENHFYLYLGSKYQDISVGTRYVLMNGYVYEVAGILEAGYRYIKNIIPGNISTVVTMDYTENCDYSIFCVADFALGNEIYVSVEKPDLLETTITQIQHMIENKGMTSVYCTMKETFQSGMGLSNRLVKLMVGLIGIVWGCCFVVNLCFRIVLLWEQEKKHGILLTQGFSKRFLMSISIIKEMIIFTISLFCAMAIGFWIVRKWYVWDEGMFLFQKLFGIYILPFLIVHLLIVMVVGLGVTESMLKKKTPIQILKA